MRWQSKNSGVWRRSDATTGGPIVTFGTKCPSITSTWSQSAAGTTSPTCSANSPKSADSTDGAMRRSPGRPGSRRTVVVPSSMGSRRSAEAGPAEDAPEPVEVRLALDDLARRLELVTVNLHAHDLILRAQLVEEIGVQLRREHETAAVFGHVPVERIDERGLVGHRLRQQVRRVAEVRGHLEGQLAIGAEGRAHARQEVEVVVD